MQFIFSKSLENNPMIYKYDIAQDVVETTATQLSGMYSWSPAVQDKDHHNIIYAFKRKS